MNTLTRSLLPVAVAATLAACGGGGYGGDNNNPPPPPPVDARRRPVRAREVRRTGCEQQRRQRSCDRCGRQASSSGSARTCELFVGRARTSSPSAPSRRRPSTAASRRSDCKDFKEVQNDNDQVLGNILVLLRALDADGDPTNGVKIDAAANTAIATAVRRQDRELQPGCCGVRGRPGDRRACSRSSSGSSPTPKAALPTSSSCSRRATRARSR